MKNRIIWMLFIVLWISSTFVLVFPFLYWIFTGKDWIDPELVHDKLFIN
jgi:hypothetical protein